MKKKEKIGNKSLDLALILIYRNPIAVKQIIFLTKIEFSLIYSD